MSFNFFKENKIIIAVFMTIVICTVDLLTPLWYDVWVLYLLPLFFMFQSAKRPYIYSAIVTLLISAGLFFSNSDSISLLHAAANRITGIFGGWGVSILLTHLKRLQISQIQTNSELEKRVEDRTEQLSQANISLRKEIDEHVQAEESIKKLKRRNESILDAAGEGIMGIDTEGMQTFVNPAATRMLGYSEDELIGKRSHELWHHTKPDGRLHPSEECPIYAAFRDGTVHHGIEDVFWRKDGSCFPVEYTSTPIFEQGNLVGAVIAFSDITKTIALKEKLEKLSFTDDLTGFYNRRGFLAQAKPKLKLSLRTMEKILLIYADMDNLKAINDSSGHQAGDKALAEIANILKSTFRESDVLARLGGDEFAVLAIDTCDEKVIQERIQKNIDSYNKKADPVHKLSLSVGIVCHDPGKPHTLEDLLTKVDALMYENKLKKKDKGRKDVKVQMR